MWINRPTRNSKSIQFGSNNGSGKLYFWVFRNRDIAPNPIFSQLEPRHFWCRAVLGTVFFIVLALAGTCSSCGLKMLIQIVDEWFVFSA